MSDKSTIYPDLILAACERLEIQPASMYQYLENLDPLSPTIKLELLHLAIKYGLDPIVGEIQIVDHQQECSVMITIDGWMKLMNSHPHFQGLSLREAPCDKDEVPTWMECTIYRDDRILPVIVKEHLHEVRTEYELWQSMPRRMLRHRVIQQCARLAFGIACPERHHLCFDKKPRSSIDGTDDAITKPYQKLKTTANQPMGSGNNWLKNELMNK